MKKIIIILGVLTLAFSSCLKDKPNVDFSNLGTTVELVESGKAYFSHDAITATSDTIATTFQVNVASPSPPTSDVTVNLAVDNSLIIADPAVGYVTMPTTAYKLSATTVTIKAGQRLANVTLTIYKNLLDASKSYQLPIKIVTTSVGIISGNFGVHYYHIIGNDFAGTYKHDYTRLPASGNYTGQSATFVPISTTEFYADYSGYYTGTIRYDVTFTKTGTGTTAAYSNFNVTIQADDLTSILTANSITLTTAPSIVAGGYSSTASYTYAQAIELFSFQYQVLGSSGARTVTDKYYK
ncbi:MAG: DUF1735 domain-containing protein [Janthinobacterium lividum]